MSLRCRFRQQTEQEFTMTQAEQTIKNTLSTQRLQRRGPTTSLFSWLERQL